MPDSYKILTAEGMDNSRLLAIALGAAEQLNWQVTSAADERLLVNVLSGETINGEMQLEILNGQLKATHQGDEAEVALHQFATAFETASKSDESNINTWQERIVQLKERAGLMQTDPEEAEDLNKVMGSGTKVYITYGIIAINILVFVLMLIDGVDVLKPTAEAILKWGGNFLPFTANGEWWRLLTSVFVHIGIIHLLFNMYALFIIGGYLEPMLGRTRFIVAYLSTGLFASLASLWWHSPPVASAGASGAIFGLFGVFLALLTTNLIPRRARNEMLKGIAILVGYNLIYGMRSGVDNAAHIGGLLSGMMIGYIYFFQLRKKEEITNEWLQPAFITIAAVLISFFYLRSERVVAKKDDTEKFSRTVEHFTILEEMALDAMRPKDTASKEVFLQELKKTALVDWTECVNLMEDAEKLELPPFVEGYRLSLLEYSNQRLQQALLYIRAIEEDTEKYDKSIDSIQSKITTIIEELKQKDPMPKTSEPPVDL